MICFSTNYATVDVILFFAVFCGKPKHGKVKTLNSPTRKKKVVNEKKIIIIKQKKRRLPAYHPKGTVKEGKKKTQQLNEEAPDDCR